MKIKKHKQYCDFGEYLDFKGNFCTGRVYYDGSGYLWAKPKVYGKYLEYLEESGKHKYRVKDIENIVIFYNKVLKELNSKKLQREIKNLKLKS